MKAIIFFVMIFSLSFAQAKIVINDLSSRDYIVFINRMRTCIFNSVERNNESNSIKVKNLEKLQELPPRIVELKKFLATDDTVYSKISDDCMTKTCNFCNTHKTIQADLSSESGSKEVAIPVPEECTPFLNKDEKIAIDTTKSGSPLKSPQTEKATHSN